MSYECYLLWHFRASISSHLFHAIAVHYGLNHFLHFMVGFFYFIFLCQGIVAMVLGYYYYWQCRRFILFFLTEAL